MPSTHKRRLSDFLKPFAKSSTFNFATVETYPKEVRLVNSASTAADDIIFLATGPNAIQAVRFVPELAVASDASNHWDLTITDRGTDGLGSTAVATFTTNGNAWVAYKKSNLYVPANEVIVADGQVWTLGVVKTGAPSNNMQGYIVVEYIPLMDS